MKKIPVFLISIMKDECPYILEFIAHYQILGVERIIIATNNNSDQTIALLEKISRVADLDFFEHSVEPGGNPQKNGYRICFGKAKELADNFYAYPADADEFLCLTEDENIHAYINRFSPFDSISFNWRFFGSGGHIKKPAGLVMDNYKFRADDSHRSSRTLKTLSFCGDNIRGIGIHLPLFVDYSRAKALYSDGTRIDPDLFRSQATHQAWVTPGHGLAELRHYGLKSAEEYAQRRKRGSSLGGDVDRYRDEYFTRYDQNVIFDPMPDGWVDKVKKRMDEIFRAANLGEIFDRDFFGLDGKK